MKWCRLITTKDYKGHVYDMVIVLSSEDDEYIHGAYAWLSDEPQFSGKTYMMPVNIPKRDILQYTPLKTFTMKRVHVLSLQIGKTYMILDIKKTGCYHRGIYVLKDIDEHVCYFTRCSNKYKTTDFQHDWLSEDKNMCKWRQFYEINVGDAYKYGNKRAT